MYIIKDKNKILLYKRWRVYLKNKIIKLSCVYIFVGIVGEMEEAGGQINYYIWTHKKFDIGYNGKYIVDVNLTSEYKVKLDLSAKIPFTYEVNWKSSAVKFEDRFDKYLDPNFFQHRVSQMNMLFANAGFCLLPESFSHVTF